MTNDLNATTFGASACSYAAARPRYPASLFDWIADLAPAKRLAKGYRDRAGAWPRHDAPATNLGTVTSAYDPVPTVSCSKADAQR